MLASYKGAFTGGAFYNRCSILEMKRGGIGPYADQGFALKKRDFICRTPVYEVSFYIIKESSIYVCSILPKAAAWSSYAPYIKKQNMEQGKRADPKGKLHDLQDKKPLL